MASGQMGFGSPGKYDLTMEQEARVWVEQVIGEELVKVRSLLIDLLIDRLADL